MGDPSPSFPAFLGLSPASGEPSHAPRGFGISHLSPGAPRFLEPGPSSPLRPAPLSGRDRCEELAVGTNAVTGTGTKEEDRV